jgi:STE24 endopeptidase
MRFQGSGRAAVNEQAMKRFLLGVAAGAGLALAIFGAARAVRAEPPQPTKTASAEETAAQVQVTPAMVRYSYIGYTLYFVGAAWSGLAWLLLLRLRVGARLRDLAESKSRNGLVQALIYYPLLTLAHSVLLLPLAFYSSFLLPHQYALSTETLGTWVTDRAQSFAISSAVGAPVVALLYWTLRRSPRFWWLGFWLASIPLLIAGMILGPLVVDPLYNRFEPLRNQRLKDRLLGLAAKAGIERSRVFEVDASKRTQGINAYVTGIGGSARIVLWDTLLQKLNEDEVVSVMAHEMGHYVEWHVPLGVAGGIAGTLGLLLITDRAGRWLIRRKGDRWQIRGLDDPASLPVLLLMLLALNFVGSPVESAISRTFERRADEFSLRLTGDGRSAASSFVKLSEKNLSLPDPPAFIQFWTGSHPSLKQRIDRALQYEQEHPSSPTP